ncbi:SsrA-binding protein SmpB [Patescibacteria group bacterium]|nr:SsrA-binding protein SmpB [Patescibacteria group bacterium]MBU1673780.1 SsrA-binding protein SmpB [Patescibacteria group bacterium]MBU1964120.1 SsrA-binding protein SmpB [Patescibacteria group bacterium]
MPTLATNKQGLYNYEVKDKFEAGIVLSGCEVKSTKKGHVNLKGSYVSYEKGDLWLKNAHISAYQAKNQPGYDPIHPRKLLMKRTEIDSLMGKSKQKGLTILPISLYTKGGLIKVKVGLARGKKAHDKRDLIKKRDADRRIGRALRKKLP